MTKKEDERRERFNFYKKQIDNLEGKLEKITKVVWDGRQYSVRIPKRLAELVGIKQGDRFIFRIKNPPHDSKEKPKLVGEWLGEED